MSNHQHLVLCVQQDVALGWDDREVARRWIKLFDGKPLVRSFVAGEELSEAQKSAVSSLIERYRERLFSISWFMRCLNEPIARQANAEDNVTGRFWEGRRNISRNWLHPSELGEAQCPGRTLIVLVFPRFDLAPGTAMKNGRRCATAVS